MRNLIKAEVYKLFHGKELIVCIAAVMLVSIITIAFGGYENGKTALTTESREIIGLVICTLFFVFLIIFSFHIQHPFFFYYIILGSTGLLYHSKL